MSDEDILGFNVGREMTGSLTIKETARQEKRYFARPLTAASAYCKPVVPKPSKPLTIWSS
jgi:hypothetical protein